jgi:hypothetical protein
MRNSRLAALAVAITAVMASPATGATWKRVTAPDGDSLGGVGLARAPDGTLHVASRSGASVNDTTIGANGAVGGTALVSGVNHGGGDPAIVAGPDGLRVFFPGTPPDPNAEGGIFSAFAPYGGTYAVEPGPIASGTIVSESPVTAVNGPGNVPFFAFFNSQGLFAHRGLSPGDPVNRFQPDPCCATNDRLAVDGQSGQVWLGWYSLESGGTDGDYAQMVDPGSGAPAGDRMHAPGGLVNGFDQVAITGRGAGHDGVFLASYSLGSRPQTIGVWKVGTGTLIRVLRSRLGGPALGHVAITSDPDGRLWVLWTVDGGPKLHVTAVRSNKTATRFGAPVDVTLPRGVVLVTRLFGDAGIGGLDAVAKFRRGDSYDYETTRILARLSLAVKRRGRKITATVTDAGDPVKGATVTAQGRRKKTNSAGKAVLITRSARRVPVTATAPGYTRISVRR